MRKLSIFLLLIPIFAACASQPQSVENIRTIEPEFEIVSIAIIQSELINTEFETILRVVNPNNFDVELSSIKYELHGNGQFWANGIENDILLVPAKSSSETRFRFSMNFIGMNRRILDDVIAMRNVQYRFKGDAQVRPGNMRIPAFNMGFDCSGYSEVKPKAD
jgi:LEA14-like dessication related protein